MNTLLLLTMKCDWSPSAEAQATSALPDDVRARAHRYRCPEARMSLVVTQTCLRQLIVGLGLDPLRLQVSEDGRPFLADSRFEFNLSHSGKRALLVVTRDPALEKGLGADIEWMDRQLERDALAKRFFTDDEFRFAKGDRAAFFHIWTRKEAVLKSNGVGLRVPLDGFHVLHDYVGQEVSGRELHLQTRRLPDDYMMSWAVLKEWQPYREVWIEAFEDDWVQTAVRALEGIDL